MTRAIITGCEGSHHKQIASITVPKMQSYAVLEFFGREPDIVTEERWPTWAYEVTA